MEAGLINDWQLNSALGEQKQWGGRLASVMVSMGFVDEATIASLLEKQLGESCISLDGREIAPDVLKRMKVDIAKKYGVIPIEFDAGTLVVATSDPTDLKVLDELGFILNVRVRPALALESGIKRAIARHYEGVVIGSRIPPARAERSGKMQMANELPEAPVEKKEFATKSVVEALLALLMEKNVITKEEIMKKLAEKGKQG